MWDETINAFGRTCPDIAVTVLEYRSHGVARQPRQYRDSFNRKFRPGGRGRFHAPQTLTDRGHPEVAIPVVKETIAPPCVRATSRSRPAKRSHAKDRIGGPEPAVGILAETEGSKRIGGGLDLFEGPVGGTRPPEQPFRRTHP